MTERLAKSAPLAISDVRAQIAGQPHLTSLIYADAAGFSKPLAAGLSRIGRRSTIVRTPLDAIRGLQEGTIAVDAVFASLWDHDTSISGLFEFLEDQHPRVRRIAFAQHNPREEGTLSVTSCRHDMILWDPWDRANFVEILKDAIDCRVSRTHSSWTDLRLFESRGGADKLAIAEILKRYRHRIVRLVSDAAHEGMDTAHVVQDAYRSIVSALPSFDRVCAPGEWIDRITRRSARSYRALEASNTSQSRGERRQELSILAGTERS